jgi:hypothetical protein
MHHRLRTSITPAPHGSAPPARRPPAALHPPPPLPSPAPRQQAENLRYIMEAPKLEIGADERVTIPLIESDTWRRDP